MLLSRFYFDVSFGITPNFFRQLSLERKNSTLSERAQGETSNKSEKVTSCLLFASINLPEENQKHITQTSLNVSGPLLIP